MMSVLNTYVHIRPLLSGIFMMLVWESAAMGGTIKFDFEQKGAHCFVINRGDSAAYYPAMFQLDSSGQWLPLQSKPKRAELRPSLTMSALLLKSPDTAAQTSIERLGIVLIRFYDQAGVAFGQVGFLRPLPATPSAVTASYAGSRLRIAAPSGASAIRSTWLLIPHETGIAPVTHPVDFTHHQPPAVRIEWRNRAKVDMDTGPAAPAVTLVHETPHGFSVQKILTHGGRKSEQRAAWLQIRRLFYVLGTLCGIGGVLCAITAYRAGRAGVES
ncbi:hypothetical protein FO488_12720 [Geobacter sp. FeAm09]|uniref:hypothetical protein n=1 Tax=Geobacter sp. FeAm09 TaxID=2597769 RepID=UPI0011F0170F|nr:hypothetical protein [Geobacter sp. FeAm09]QEM68932.1 hypothetical protein FO488_12720 [Geobacter sp. FeAm09]